MSGVLSAATPKPSTLVVIPFHNRSQFSDLNWVGEGIAETLMGEFRDANEIVLDRDARTSALKRLSLRSDADYTLATLIRIGQTAGADYVCYGTYDVDLPAGESELRKSFIRLTTMFLDLRKMQEGPEFSEAGNLAELSRLEEHLAWQSLNYLVPDSHLDVQQFMAPEKLVRVDAQESYIRGLLSQNIEQRQKWMMQAVALDPKFSSPVFELGRLALARNDYRQAISWFQKIPATEPRYLEARFETGLAQFGAGDYSSAADSFREVAKTFPLNEVYNNLGAAENELHTPAALDYFRRAADGDPNDATYQFNLGLALLLNKQFQDAVKRFQRVLDLNAADPEAQKLLLRAQNQETPEPASAARERLKKSLHDTAFRQLKAVLQSKNE
jgi:tetratricopeptide (TPR) repeat protein